MPEDLTRIILAPAPQVVIGCRQPTPRTVHTPKIPLSFTTPPYSFVISSINLTPWVGSHICGLFPDHAVSMIPTRGKGNWMPWIHRSALGPRILSKGCDIKNLFAIHHVTATATMETKNQELDMNGDAMPRQSGRCQPASTVH